MRLIDADALIGEMHNIILEAGEDRRVFYAVIERQPTIEEPHWIPCSVALPKTSGNYYVTEKQFSVDDKNRTGKFTLETAYAYYSNHWQRAKFLEVVAWMPNEPWRGDAE